MASTASLKRIIFTEANKDIAGLSDARTVYEAAVALGALLTQRKICSEVSGLGVLGMAINVRTRAYKSNSALKPITEEEVGL